MTEDADLRAFARPHWEALKLAHSRVGVRRLPGFAASLAALHADGWGQSDIALMFGMTRERVRQWFRACGLKSQFWGSRPRLWSWDAGRFMPVANAAMRVQTLARRAQLVAELRTLERRLGRTPRIGELRLHYPRFFRVLGGAWRESGERRWQVWVRRWYQAAGLVVPRRGTPGHAPPQV